MKRVSIVFQETGQNDERGKGFEVFLEGANELADSMTPEQQMRQLGTADFWALRCFQICSGLMQDAGVIKLVKNKGG